MAHLLEHMHVQGHADRRGNLKTELGKRGMRFNGITSLRPHELLRNVHRVAAPTSTGRSRWKPIGWCNSKIGEGRSRHRDDGRAQRISRAARTIRRACCRARCWPRAYDWHNYGKQTDRRTLRHRERVDIARLQAFYHTVLPAGQRRADRRRQVRSRRRRSAASSKYFGTIPKPARMLPTIYTRRAGAGRRARGDACAASATRSSSASLLSHGAAARIRTPSPFDALARHHDRRARRAGCTRRWSKRKRPPAVESWTSAQHDPGFVAFFAQVPMQRLASTPARDTMLATLENVRQDADHRGRSRSRAREGAEVTSTTRSPIRRSSASRSSESIASGDWRLLLHRSATASATVTRGRRAARRARRISSRPT